MQECLSENLMCVITYNANCSVDETFEISWTWVYVIIASAGTFGVVTLLGIIMGCLAGLISIITLVYFVF